MIISNLGPISHRFQDMISFPLKTHIFSTPCIEPEIWKCFPCITFSKFCTRRASIQC